MESAEWAVKTRGMNYSPIVRAVKTRRMKYRPDSEKQENEIQENEIQPGTNERFRAA